MKRNKRRGRRLERFFGFTAVILASAFLTAPHVLAAAFCVSLAMGG